MVRIAAAAAASVALASSAMAAAPSDVEGAIKARLMDFTPDPFAAQIVVTKGPWPDIEGSNGQSQSGDFVCAKVNNKNRLGAYVGFAPYLFIFREDGFVAVFRPDTEEGRRVLTDYCAFDLSR